MSKRLLEETASYIDTLQASPPLNDHGKSFSSSKHDMRVDAFTLDRRKVERNPGLTPIASNGQRFSNDEKSEDKKQPLFTSTHEVDRMPEPRSWRRSRARSPWSISLLTLGATAIAVAIFIFIVHAFLTRQLDPKGCDMCWSRPIYFRFNDFDTEHTRFASKYHLYLHREGGFDEDPKVWITLLLMISR